MLVNDLFPVSIQGLRKSTILQHMMVWKWHPECESALFFPYHCLIQEHHIIMHAQGPVPHTCTHHAHAPVISHDDLPLLFFIVCKQCSPKKVAMLITARHDADIYGNTATNANII